MTCMEHRMERRMDCRMERRMECRRERPMFEPWLYPLLLLLKYIVLLSQFSASRSQSYEVK